VIRSRAGVAAVLGRTVVSGRSGAARWVHWTPSMRRRCFRMLWRPLSVRGRRPRLRRGREDPRRSTVENGAGTGAAVCLPRPGTPADAAAALDVVWSPGVLPAGP